MIIHNFILSRFIGISIKTHHNIDIIAIAIYDSFKHPEICKGLHIIPQIMSHNFFIAHEFFIDKTQTQVRSFKIITRPYIILNPLIFISKRFMLNQMIKIRGEEVKGVGAVIQASNNTIHSSAIVVINTNRIRGVLNTHKPLKNQIFLRRGPFPNSKDNRDQYTTLNNIFDANMIIKDKTNLLHRTHVDKEGEEMINFNDTYSVLNPDAQWSIHTNEGHKIVDPHSETMLGIAGILEETSIWKNIRTDKYNLMSKSEQKWHRQRFAAYMNTKQKHFFFKEEKFSNPKYFEDELRTGWRNETHAPFRNISDI